MAKTDISKRDHIAQRADNLNKINEGYNDQISYLNEINRLIGKANKMQEREFKSTNDVLDKTKKKLQIDLLPSGSVFCFTPPPIKGT